MNIQKIKELKEEPRKLEFPSLNMRPRLSKILRGVTEEPGLQPES